MDINFNIPTIESSRIRLQAINESDLDDLMELWGDGETTKFIGGEQTKASAWHMVAALVGHWYWKGYGLWGIVDIKSEKVIGWSGIWNPEGWPEPELIWSINKKYWGRGLATEAALLVRNYAYRTLGFKTLISIISPENTPSISVAKRLNAQYEKNWELRGNLVNIWRHPSQDSID